jgi:hypothetical protein
MPPCLSKNNGKGWHLSKLKNNLLTVVYIDSLLQQYMDLRRLRKTSLIKKIMAVVSSEEVTEFIKHLAFKTYTTTMRRISQTTWQ